MFIKIILIEIFLLLITFNLLTSYKIITAVFYNRFQKIVQLLIMWLIPLIGFLIVAYFLKDEMSNSIEVISSNTDNNVPTASGAYVGGGD